MSDARSWRKADMPKNAIGVAIGGKADIFVFLSAISLRQCGSMRRRIAEPTLCVGSRIRSG
jgi:hypothetical protein